jgi:hypothetical protein
MMLQILANKYARMGLIAVVVFAAGGFAGFKATSAHYKGVIARKEAAHQQAVIKAQSDALAEVQRQQTITNEVSSEYENQIADLRRRSDALLAGLRNSAEFCDRSVPAQPSASRKPDATTCPKGFPRHMAEDVTRLMLDADIQTRRLMACQSWLQKQFP